MDQTIIDLYDGFTHGRINRRDFFERLTAIAGSAAAASSLYATLRPDYARAAVVADNDPRLAIDTMTYGSAQGKISGYLARPRNTARRPAILVIHENRGLTPHIKDVARRLAIEGFLALAVDLLSTKGGTPADEDKAREMFGSLDLGEIAMQCASGVSAMNGHPESTGRTGIVGFCWGGGMVDRTAMIAPDLAAAVSYYGPIPPDKSKVKDIRAPLLLHYAGLDTFVNPEIPAWEKALKAAGKTYTIYMYEGVNHAFNNDTAGPRYNKQAADLAWSRTIAFFKDHVGTPQGA